MSTNQNTDTNTMDTIKASADLTNATIQAEVSSAKQAIDLSQLALKGEKGEKGEKEEKGLTKIQQKPKNKRDKPNFELFFSDPKMFFLQTPNLGQYEKALFGFCASRNSLEHALIALSHYTVDQPVLDSLTNVNIEIKTIILSLISDNQTTQSGFQKLHELAKLPESNSEFWSITLHDFVGLLVQSTKERDERIYTLAIRFFCNHKCMAKAKILYEELTQTGILPHSRTFLPLLQGCNSYDELEAWHETVQKDLTIPPSMDFYEAFFERFFTIINTVCSNTNTTSNNMNKSISHHQEFLKVFNIYRKFYPFITPTLARLFSKNLKVRKDLKILRDGLVYISAEPKQADKNWQSTQMPIHKLDLLDISYEDKRELARVFMNSSPRGSSGSAGALSQVTNEVAMRNFEAFVQRYEISWDIVIDGANVGLYNNAENFRYDRIFSILKWARSHYYKVLVILHGNRKDSRLDGFIARDPDNCNIYYTPAHHNDDHFSLYAALTRASYILSNDEFKDHTNLLKTRDLSYGKKFMEWRTSHQIFYSFDTRVTRGDEPYGIYMPSKFSKMIQIKEGSENAMVFAPVYDLNKNPPHYLENMNEIDGWTILEIS